MARADFNTVNETKKNLEADLKERNKQLEDLKKTAGDTEALTKQIADLQAQNAQREKDNEAAINALRIDNAVEMALMRAGARNTKAVKALLDLKDAKLAADSSVPGLLEQIDKLTKTEDSSFLFEAEKPAGFSGFKPGEGGAPGGGTTGGGKAPKDMTYGIWVENDAYVPSVGDVIMYDWQDSGSGDNTGTPDHVGIVYSVSGSTMKIIEGNKSDTVGYRTIAVNGTYIRGYIISDYASAATVEVKSGWVEESDGWRFYLGDTGECVKNDWYQDIDGKWYWFDSSGKMVTNVWYLYHDNWYYLGADGAMAKGQQTIDGKWYIMGDDGVMIIEPVVLTPDDDGALVYTGLAG